VKEERPYLVHSPILRANDNPPLAKYSSKNLNLKNLREILGKTFDCKRKVLSYKIEHGLFIH
jgi:hypothetical protein